MISFKQFLSEARMAPLYHGTNFNNIQSILMDNKGLLARTIHNIKELMISNTYDLAQGVSATRNFNFAATYNTNYTPEGIGNVVLELDQEALSRRYKIIPFNYWQLNSKVARYKEKFGGHSTGNRRNEYEEFILTKNPIPAKYIIRIYIPSKITQYDVIGEIRQKFGSSFIRTY